MIDGAKGKPVPFEFGGFTYLLRPVTRSEVLALTAWRDGEGDKPGAGRAMQERIVSMAICDESGKPLLSEKQVVELPNAAIDAVADEVARRNWGPPEGKADPAKTTG